MTEKYTPEEIKKAKKQEMEDEGRHLSKELGEQREEASKNQEMTDFFGCTLEEIARAPQDIREKTKAYVGKLEPGIFEIIQKNQIEHVYTEFPEGKLARYDLEIGGLGRDEFYEEMRKVGTDNATGTGNYLLNQMFENENYTKFVSERYGNQPYYFKKEKESLELISVRVKDLFSDDGWHPLTEIYERAKKLGLELAPAATGPYLRFKLVDQPEGERLYIAMEPVYVLGVKDIFCLKNSEIRNVDDRVVEKARPRLVTTLAADPERLTGYDVDPKTGSAKFDREAKFVFSLPSVKTEEEHKEIES